MSRYPIVERAVRRDLGSEWRTPREIADRLQLSRNTVRHALRDMADRGEIDTEARPLPAPLLSVNIYRKAAG